MEQIMDFLVECAGGWLCGCTMTTQNTVARALGDLFARYVLCSW